jgi:hypothetical protein
MAARTTDSFRRAGRVVVATAWAALGPLLASGCSQPFGPETSAAISSPIAFGTLDSAHTAVVALLSPVGTTQIQECTGSVVQVKGGNGYVLTAAHCCNKYPPTVVVLSSSYVVGEQYVGGTPPQPPAYAVVPGSVYYDGLYSQHSGVDHDFCMMRFSGAQAGTATLALPSTSDGLSLGASIQHVGYGVTESGANPNRRSGTDVLDLQLTATYLEFSQGGPDATPGTCDGDSGGPSLLPAGASQSGQVVVGVQSYGSAAPCAQITFGVASRVASAMGTGGFISSYVADTPIGVQAGAGAPASAMGGGWPVLLLVGALLVVGARGVRMHA